MLFYKPNSTALLTLDEILLFFVYCLFLVYCVLILIRQSTDTRLPPKLSFIYVRHNVIYVCVLYVRSGVFTQCCIIVWATFGIYTHTHTHTHRVGSRFATVRFTAIHFYEPCRVGPSTPDLWCITVATQASCLYLVRF
jgi:hypothetical protein